MPFKSNESLKQTLSVTGLVIACSIVVIINGRLGVPIWIDEFLHFALGSHNSLQEVWTTISNTTTNINHGQTGTYMILDYWLLKAFGANLVALRLPSLITAFWMLFCSLLILRILGLKLVWQYLLILLLVSQPILMRYVGEARPYMPLVAASVGCLAYYMIPLDLRKKWWAVTVGLVSIVLGVLMHPYFSVYWASLCFYAYWHAIFSNKLGFSIKSLLLHMNAPLIFLGSILYFVVGRFTWMRGRPEFLFDPFQYIERDQLLDTFINQSLFQFLSPLGFVFLGICAFILLCYPMLKHRTKARLKPLISPVALIMLMVLIAFFLSFVSYITDYWILQRQWVVSIAVIPIATTWLLFEISRLIPKQYLQSSRLVLAVIILSFSIRVCFSNVEKVEDFIFYLKPGNEHHFFIETTSPDNDVWVNRAQQNIEEGGPVWPVFRRFYQLEN